MPKNITVKNETHARIVKYTAYLTAKDGKKRTLGDGVDSAFTESEWLPELKKVLASASEKIEASKQYIGKRHVGIEGANELVQVLTAFIASVEKR